MTPRVAAYVRQAAELHKVDAADILGRSTLRRHCEARAHVMRWLRRDGFTTLQIGRWLGRDHSTVVHWTTPGSRERRNEARTIGELLKPVIADIIARHAE